jgi:hypothetical protein
VSAQRCVDGDLLDVQVVRVPPLDACQDDTGSRVATQRNEGDVAKQAAA